jgi:Ni/Co efflux regulator RcnB
MAQGGGPTNFTNEVRGQQPDQGQNRGGDRGGRGQQAAPQVAQQPAPAQPQGTWSRDPNRPMQGQPDRGNAQGRPPQQAVAPQGPMDQNRGNRQGRGNDNRGNDNRFDNRGNDNRGFRGDNRPGFDNRGSFNGQRRDWRGYSNYHRDWRPTQRFRAPAYRRPPGFYVHRWNFGDFLPSLFWGRDYWLDYRIYDLPPPPPGATWVRVGDDALLIDQYSGEVITVSYNVFY